MTISSTTLARVQYNGNGSTTAFSVPFVFSTSADLKVYITVVSTGVETLKTLTTHYTVSGGGGSGSPTTGTVTFLTAPATGERVTILRSVANTQGVDYVENDTFPAQTHEGALDKLTMQVQDLKENLTRAIVFTPGSTSTNIEVSTPVAGSVVKWDSTASILESVSLDTVAAPISLSATGMLACTALTPRAYAGRTLTAGNQISISNGDGVSGNPTIAVSTALHNLASVGNGILTRTASDTYTNRTITGTSNQITVTNGDGVSGNPTISIPSGLIAPGTITSTSHITLNAASELRLADSDSSNYVGFVAPGTVSSNRIWTLPSADGTSGQVLQTNGSGTLSFGTISGSSTLEFVSTTTTSGSATQVDFTSWDFTTYKRYLIFIEAWNSTGIPQLRFFDSTGTIITTSTYTNQRMSGSLSTINTSQTTGASSIGISGNVSTLNISLEIECPTVTGLIASNDHVAMVKFHSYRLTGDNIWHGNGQIPLGTGSVKITGVRIYTASGNITNGSILTLYRVRGS